MHDDELFDVDLEEEEFAMPVLPPDRVAMPMTAWGLMVPQFAQAPTPGEEDEEKDVREMMEQLREDATEYLSLN